MGAFVTRTFTCIDGRYEVTEYGKGTAYLVEDSKTMKSFYVQGDDAQTLRNDSQEFTNKHAIVETMAAIGE